MSAIRQDLELELLEKGDEVGSRSKLSDALLDQCIAFNYKRTFAIMSERRVVREYKGVYVKLFTWLLVVYILSVLVADIIRSRDPHQELFSADNLGASLLNLVLVVIMVQVCAPIALVIRWLISWVIIAELAIYLVTGDIKAVFWQETSISEKKAQARRIIVLILIIMEGLTIATYCYTHHVYPWLDNALIWSEILSRESIFDPLVYSIGKRVEMLHRDPDGNNERANRASRWSLFRGARATVSAELDNEAVEMNEKSQFPGVASVVFNDLPSDSPCHPHDDPDSAASNRDFLDVDVVDTTWMDNNVHAVRHNYFNLNPTMIDDLRQIIVSKRRARHRPGLLHTSANIHIFLVAPGHIKND
ncbi:hypothetical protein P43SY_004418 [Pythium insidiosum]|uniref:Transmembrane protein n=1 Tax=Pythium insidiosum TaxID=114742 RepID=A0AAD5QEA1_PYTIN|nr:hypothetical protein P43SY_004418 [Pythium insidiosum]